MKIIQLFTLFMLLATAMPSRAASWVVSYGQSLQTAISNAAAGDNITVMTGIYNEDVSVNKGLTIQGSGGAVQVTGFLTVTNATLPVYFSDIAFGKVSDSGITIANCQSVRFDRCSLVGGGDLNVSGCQFYCYKNNFQNNVSIINSTWTFQRCNVSGNLNSYASVAKFIASNNGLQFIHNQGEITIFQSVLTGFTNSISLAPTNNGWVCYNSFQTMNLSGGTVQIVGNRIGLVPQNQASLFYGGNYIPYILTKSDRYQGMYKAYNGIYYPKFNTDWGTVINILNNSGAMTSFPLTSVGDGCNAIFRNNIFLNSGPNQDVITSYNTRYHTSADGQFFSDYSYNYYIDVQSFSSLNPQAVRVNANAGLVNILNNNFHDCIRGVYVAQGAGGVIIRGNIFSGSRMSAAVVSDANGAVIDYNNANAPLTGGAQANNINVDPQYTNPGLLTSYNWADGIAAVNVTSPTLHAGPPDALYYNFDGTTNNMGYYGGHSYDPTGLTTTNPVVLSGSVTPLYVKQGQAVTVSARAAVVAAP